jgi:diguanylate cyclase (GGDEF)-like protein/PAS domain S-box-containing protein
MVLKFSDEIDLLKAAPAEIWDVRLQILERCKNLILLVRRRQICFVNDVAIASLGYSSKHELLGADLLSLFVQDYYELGEMGLDVMSQEQMIPMKLVRHDGGEIDVELWVDSVAEPQNEIFVIEARNITAHLRAARALRSREQWLEGVINTVADGIVTVDHRGIVQSFNPAAERIFRFRADEIIGKSIRELVPSPIADQVGDSGEWTSLSLLGQELMGKRKDGDVFPMEMALREMLQGDNVSYTGVVRDISARRRAEERIRHLAQHDPLTNLPNRFLFGDRLDAAITRASRHKDRLAVVFIDLNDFKPINDEFGHAVGDRALILLSERLKRNMRKTDTIARIGGDEFVVILEEISGEEHLRVLAQKVMAAVTEPFEVDGNPLKISASLGIALFPDDTTDADQLVEFADRAMYVAKKQGKCHACIHPDDAWQIAPAGGN